MTKPQEFQEQTTIQHETTYLADPHYPRGPQAASGVLGAGRVVWTSKQHETSTEDGKATAFADGIGVVAVEPASLGQ